MALHNLARMTSATTGTGTLTLGSAVSGFLSFADAGVVDGEKVTYAIRDGSASEIGRGTYTASGTTLSRDVIYESTNSGNAINCSGSQEVFVTAAAENIWTAPTVTTVTTSNLTAALNTRYILDVSGLTANRNFILPAGAPGDWIEVNISTGDDTYELVIIGDTGISINGGSAATEWARLFMAGESVRLIATSATNWQVMRDGRRESYVVLQDQKTSGTNAGTFTSGSYATRVLNTEVQDDDGICTLSSNQFTLRAGTYRIRAVCPAVGVNSHRAKLYNISDSADVILSDSAYAAVNEVNSPAIVSGKFTITATKTFEIRHQCQTTKATYGLGAAYATFGLNEYYTMVELWRVG